MLHKEILDNVPFGVIRVNSEGIVKYMNKAILRMWKLKGDLPENGQHIDSLNTLIVSDGGRELSLWSFVHEKLDASDGNSHLLQASLKIHGNLQQYSLSIHKGSDGTYTISVIEHDEELNSSTHVHEDADRYKTLLENIKGVVWESTIGTKTFTYISPQVETLFGFSRGQWLEDGFWQSRIFEADRDHVVAYETQKALDVESYQLEYRMLDKQENIVWVQDSVDVVRINDLPVKLRGMMLDITDQKESRNLLRYSEKRFRALIDEAPYAITVFDSNGILVAANAKSAAFWMVDLKRYIGTFDIFKNRLFKQQAQQDSIRKAFAGQRGEITSDFFLPHTDKTKNFRIKYYPLFDAYDNLENVIYITEDITQLVQAGMDIKYEESLKQGVLDALDQAILVIDRTGKIISTNSRLDHYVDRTPSNRLEVGRSIFEFSGFFEDEESIKAGLQAILDQESNVLDHEMKLADGKWYSIRATPLENPFGAVVTWQNINTRKEIEMALEKSLKKYRNIYNKAPVMMHSINDRLEIVSVSDFWLDKMGYDRNEVLGKTPADFLADNSKGVVAANFERLFAEGFVRNAEYTFRKKNGEEIEVILSAVAEYDERGKFERSITGMLDVSELKQAERKLQDSQSKLLEAQRISNIANYEFDIATGTFEPSAEMISMMGFYAEDKHVSIIEKLIHPEDLPEFGRKLEDSISTGLDFFHVYRVFHLRSQSMRWISGRGKILKDANRKPVKMIGTVQDITEQKQAEQKIKKLSDRVLLATEIAHLGVWEYDRERDEIIWEDQMYAIFPHTKTPLTIETLGNYIVEEDKSLLLSSLQMIKSGVNFLESEVRIRVKDEVKYIRAFTRVIRDQQDKLKGMVGVVYDISVDKNLQRQLEQSLEEKNVLVKEVHHRVKNNMQLISSILALKSYELDSEKSKLIFEEINDRIKAMAVIHDKLYTFYNVSEVDVSEYLNHLAHELQTILLSSNFSVLVESEPIIFDVEKALLMGLIVSEMVGNAVKHGFKGRQDGEVKVIFHQTEEGYLLRVLNNGSKMEKEVIDSSTGLGISLIKTFTKQLGGKLEYDDANGLKVLF